MNDVFIADTHLNVATYGGIDRDGLSFRSRDFMAALSWAVDKLMATPPTQVFLLGDIYNDSHPSNKARRFFKSQVRRLSEAGIAVHILVGNHDAGRTDHAIEPIIESGLENVHVYYSPTVVKTADAAYFIYPHSETVERQEKDLRSHFLETVAEWQKEDTGKLTKILCAHLPIYGAKDSDGHSHEDQDSVRLDDLALLGADYAFLGDFHAHQKLNLPKTEGYYVGSLERTNFKDLQTPKGFMRLQNSATFVEYDKTRPLRQVEGGLADLEKAIADPTVSQNSIVKLKFVGNVVESQEFEKRQESIKKDLLAAGARLVLIEKDVRDPQREAQVAQLAKEIQNFDEIGTRDLEDVIESVIKTVVTDDEERRLVRALFHDVAATVGNKRKASGIASGTLRLHGMRLHNMFRYGTENNIVEFHRGAADILGNKRIAQWEKDLLIKRSKELLAEWTSNEEKKMLSITGMTDGDERRSNGAGKSSIPEGLSYALFEKTVHEFAQKEDREKGKSTLSVVQKIRGVYAPEAFVELLFSVDDTLWLLKRGRKMKKNDKHEAILQLDCLVQSDDYSEGSHSGHLAGGDEELLSELIGMSYETFCNSSMFGQFDAGQFVTGSHKIRQGIIINVLRLGIIAKYLEEIRERNRAIGHDIENLDIKLAMLETAAKVDLEGLKALFLKTESTLQGLDVEIAQAEQKVQSLRKVADLAVYESAKSELAVRRELVVQKRKERDSAGESLNLQRNTNNSNLVGNRNRRSIIESQSRQFTAAIATLKSAIAAFDAVAHAATLAKVQQAKEAHPKRKAQIAEGQQQRLVLERERSEMQGRRNAVESELTSVRELLKTESVEVRCPHCHGVVSKDHLQSEISDGVARIKEWDEKIKTHTDAIAKLNAAGGDLERRMTAILEFMQKESGLVAASKDQEAKVQKLKSNEDSLAGLTPELVELQDKIQVQEREDARLKTAYDDLGKQFTPEISALEKRVKESADKCDELEKAAKGSQERVAAADRALGVLRGDKDSQVAESARLKAQIGAVEAAQKQHGDISKQRDVKVKVKDRLNILDRLCGPDGIQTNIVERYIPLLNSYLQEYLSAVSGNELQAAIVTDGKREGKIDIHVAGECSEEAKDLSGGEGVKFRLALDIALGLLSFARSRNAPDFICLDEVLAPVDRQTKDWVFTMLRKLQDRFRMVLVISHDEALQRQLKSTIVVNKVNGISQIARQYYELPPAAEETV